jgi:succinate dehydrogenase / fumarate reductase cytochrome b subunit
MSWLANTLLSSIGKKLMMAITGLCFCGFLIGHLAGNLTIYMGKDAFNSYAERLHALGSIITLVEWVLLFLALVHIATGITLFYQNFKARPVRYSVNQRAGGRTVGSATMPYTGFILIFFIVLHLINFHFTDKTDTTIYEIVHSAFANFFYVVIYVFAMIVAAIHVSHGLWSAFQTLGANHVKYMPLIRGLSYIFSLIIVFGFGFLPIYLAYMA